MKLRRWRSILTWKASGIRFSVATERTTPISGKVVGTGNRGSPNQPRSFTRRATLNKCSEARIPRSILTAHSRSPTLGPASYTLIAKATTNDGRAVEKAMRRCGSWIRIFARTSRWAAPAKCGGKVEASTGLLFAGKQIILQSSGMILYPSISAPRDGLRSGMSRLASTQ